MNADLENLIVLQAQDLDLLRLQQQLAAGPERIRAAEAAVSAATKALEQTRTALAAEDRLRRSQESEIATQRVKIERLRRSLDTATSAPQVAAFEKEIGFAQDTVARLEDEEYSSLERTEALEAALGQTSAEAERTEKLLVAARAEVASSAVADRDMLTGIQGQRTALRAATDAAKLAQYDRLSKVKGTAVAEAIGNASGGRCAACQMAVRAQRWQDLTGRDHADEIFTCDSCGRMLFWDPRRDTPRAWEAGDRLRRAGVVTAAKGREA